MKVLFVCSGNAHRSPLAEALLKKFRPDLQVDSAGLHIAIPISEEVKSYLTEENAAQFIKKFPESLASKPLKEYDLIVAMQNRHKEAIVNMCPQCGNKTAVWDIEDPYFMDPRDARRVYRQIKEKVEELASSL